MSPAYYKKISTSFSLGIAVVQILIGAFLVAGAALFLAGSFAFRGASHAGYIVFVVLFLLSLAPGAVLLYNGTKVWRLLSNYQKIALAMTNHNRIKIAGLAKITRQSVTNLVRDLRALTKKGYFPQAYLDFNRKDFVLQRDNWPAPVFKEGDVYLREEEYRSRRPLLAAPLTLAVYALLFPLTTWYHFVIGLVLCLIALAIAAKNYPVQYRIVEKKYAAPPPPKPVKFCTGNDDLDELLTSAQEYTNELTAISLGISGKSMQTSVAELLSITKQIFAFIEKNPGKIRQIRQFMNYYLPTTIKLLRSYNELTRQPLKGENILQAMTKIETSMAGITETFRKELDNLYCDKTEDIAVDVDMMLSMMRQQTMSQDFSDNIKG